MREKNHFTTHARKPTVLNSERQIKAPKEKYTLTFFMNTDAKFTTSNQKQNLLAH